MIEFCATERIGGLPYSRRVRAASWADAEDTCAIRGWKLDGEFVCEIDEARTTPQQMAELCCRRNCGGLDS